MIAMARMACQLTQAACAEKVGISQALLSKIEDGLVGGLPIVALDQLSALTGYPVEFFRQPGHRKSMGDAFFRKRQSLPAATHKMCDALINIKRMEIERLLLKTDLEVKDRPYFDPDEFGGGPREIARHLRHFWGLPQGPVTNLTEIVEDAGVVVVHCNLGSPKIDGVTTFSNDGTPIVILNPSVPCVRLRATLAHEFGHVIMHKVPKANMEEESFDFASEFMMPEAEIRPDLFPMTIDRLLRLKVKWRVSMQWILKWANRMGALKDSYYRVLMMKIGQAGWRRCEPMDEQWPIEKPSLLPEVIEYHLTDLKYSVDDLRRLLLANANTFDAEYLGSQGLRVIKGGAI
jgi:Zn-dependent peptidase ImmA (M78 family)